MDYIFICIIILLLLVIVYLLIYKKRNYKEFTLDNMSYKANIINNFYAMACNKIMKFQTNSLHLKRDKDTGKYIIEEIDAICIEGKNRGKLYYFTDESEIYMTKSDLIEDLQ